MGIPVIGSGKIDHNIYKECRKCNRYIVRDLFGREGASSRHTCMMCRCVTNNNRTAWRNQNSDVVHEIVLWEEILNILARQQFRCAICRKIDPEETFRVDHCHQRGFVRGLLCNSCNTGLGLLGDTADNIARAHEYMQESLKRYPGKTNAQVQEEWKQTPDGQASERWWKNFQEAERKEANRRIEKYGYYKNMTNKEMDEFIASIASD